MKRRLTILVAVILGLGGVYLLFRHHLTIEFVIDQEERIRGVVERFPLRSLAAGFLIYVLASLVPGTFGKATIYGWIFGFWPGLIIVNVGLTAAALLQFVISRYALRDFVKRRLRTPVRYVDHALAREGGSFLLTLRLLRVPYTLLNYAAGATAAPLRSFWWTTHLGMLPGNLVFVLAGSQLPSLKDLAETGPLTLVNVPLLAALSLAALLPVLTRRAVVYRQNVRRKG